MHFSLNILNARFLLSFETSDIFLFYFSLKKISVPSYKMKLIILFFLLIVYNSNY